MYSMNPTLKQMETRENSKKVTTKNKKNKKKVKKSMKNKKKLRKKNDELNFFYFAISLLLFSNDKYLRRR